MPSEAPFRSQPARVLVAGGGVAGTELIIALHKLAGRRVAIELLTAGEHLVYRPLLVAEPFGAGSPHRFPLRKVLDDQHATQCVGRLAGVDAHAHQAITERGERLDYDALALTTGAGEVEAVPGALCFAGTSAVEPMRALVEKASAGELRTLAFALPEAAVAWPLPLYELALMTAASAPRADVLLVTPETTPLELFGANASAAVGERLERAGVALRTAAAPVRFADGMLQLAAGEPIAANAAVALPRREVPPFEGVPQERDSFVPVDDHGRVRGLEDVYAAGDVTGYPVKQGGVSVRQAQAVAECLGARAGAPVIPEPVEPVLRGMLLTGADPGYLQAGPGESQLADSPLWWPPTKIADSYLVPYLVARFRLRVPPLPGHGEADLVAAGPAGEAVPARPMRAPLE